jgi:hypothetical protein
MSKRFIISEEEKSQIRKSWGESFEADKRTLRKNADKREFIKNEKIDRITN